MPLATVIIPTHGPRPTLRTSAASVLGQTAQDLELFIVGDGVADVTRRIAAELGRDPRVRFFDNPKGPRRGEIHRHAALTEANGNIVCYLADDDLWLPTHLETMAKLLSEADFAHALPLAVQPNGEIYSWAIDLSRTGFRDLLLSGENRIPLSCGAHTLSFYRSLPFGWRTTPPELPTDLYMWQQFLARPECRAVSGTRPTVLVFPTPARTDWTTEQRVAEAEGWSARLADTFYRCGPFRDEVLRAVVFGRAADEDPAGPRGQRLSGLQADLEERTAWALRLDQDIAERNAAIRQLQRDLEERTDWATSLDRELEDRHAAIRQLQRDFEQRTAWALGLDRELAARDGVIRQLQGEFEERTAWALELDRELTARDNVVRQLQRDFEQRTAWALALQQELVERDTAIRHLQGQLASASPGAGLEVEDGG